jgi:hypothetical protein
MTYPTDLNQPGAIDELLAFHRATFGDARMEEGDEGGDGDGGTSTGEANEAGDEAGKTDETDEGKKKAEDDEGGEAKKSTLTPEQLQAELTRTRAEAANWRTKLREAEKRLSEAKSTEEYESAVNELREQVAAKDHEILKGRVAREHGLPDELAARLQGTTEAELKADAEALKKFAAPSGVKKVELRGGLTPGDDPDDTDDPRELARKYGGRRR